MVDGHENCALAIVGSRDVLGYQSESIIKAAILEHKPKIVISGGARGVDTQAVLTAKAMGVTILEFQPSEQTWDVPASTKEVVETVTDVGMRIVVPGGYKQRNESIAEACDCLVRIASHTTKTYGSGWTADQAEKLGKRVYRHTV